MAMTLITTNTHTGDSDSTSSFTSSIDSTYKLYIFKFYDINPSDSNPYFTFNGSIDGGSNYNVTKTSTYFRAHHQEDGSQSGLDYQTAEDLAQSTAAQRLAFTVANYADNSVAGELFLFNPSNTTYVKHFYSRLNWMYTATPPHLYSAFISGYFNTTDNIDAVQFAMSAGEMNGTIKMYGVG